MTSYTLLTERCVTPNLKTIATINFMGENEGDWGSVLVDNRVIRIYLNENYNIVWDKDGNNEIELLTNGENFRQLAEKRYINVTYSGIDGYFSNEFSNEFYNELGVTGFSFFISLEGNGCSDNPMPTNLIEELIAPLADEIIDPLVEWENFNKWNNRWKFYRHLSDYNQGLICPSDLTEEPKIEIYNGEETQGTFSNEFSYEYE